MDTNQVEKTKTTDILAISSNARKLFAKINVFTLEDACKLNVLQLLDLVKSNVKTQAYVDELWRYVHDLGYYFLGELTYLKEIRNLANNELSIKTNTLFMSENARKFIGSYEDIETFFNALKKSKRMLKSFLCLVITYENNDSLERLFTNTGNYGIVLSLLIKDFKKDCKQAGLLMPVFLLTDERNIYNNLIRNDYWLVGDLLKISKEKIKDIPHLGPLKTLKIINALEKKGFTLTEEFLEDNPPKELIGLDYSYIGLEKLNLSEELLKKLKAMQILNLEKLLNLRDLSFLTNIEIIEIREKLAALGFSFKDKLLAMPESILEQKYNQLWQDQKRLEKKLEIVTAEVNSYKRVLALSLINK